MKWGPHNFISILIKLITCLSMYRKKMMVMINCNRNKPPVRDKLCQVRAFLEPGVRKSNKIILQITNPDSMNELSFN